MSPGSAGKRGHICFTKCFPSAVVNHKLLLIPLVFLLSAYQFDVVFLMNLHILNWVGDIPATVGSPWLEKACITVSQWMHTHRDSSMWFVFRYLKTRDTSKNICVMAGIYQPETVCPVKHVRIGHIPTEHSRSHPGHSHSNCIISVNIKVKSKPQSIETIPSCAIARGCVQMGLLPLCCSNDRGFRLFLLRVLVKT